MEAVRYAIIDGAVEEELLAFLQKTTPPHCCLFPPPVQSDLVGLAPYLVEVTPEVEVWLNAKETPWGIYFYSHKKIHLLVQHFRHYLWVNIPEQTKPVLFRFYDPRNIWVLVDILTPLELYRLIEPVTKIASLYSNEYQENDFSSFRQSGKRSITGKSNTILSFSQRQYDLLNRQAQKNYIKTLELYINKYYIDKNVPPLGLNTTEDDFAENIFIFCQSLNIHDDRSIRGIICLLLENKIYSSVDVPSEWINILSNTEQTIHRQVETLLLQELGFLPQ